MSVNSSVIQPRASPRRRTIAEVCAPLEQGSTWWKPDRLAGAAKSCADRPSIAPMRTCLFCSNTDLTDEDIWPKWFQKWVQNKAKSAVSYTVSVGIGDRWTTPQNSKTPGGKRLIVCGSCNAG